MRPLFQHASRTIVDFAALTAAKRAGPGYPSNAFLTELSRSSTVCIQCQFSVLSSRQFGTSRKPPSQSQPKFLTHARNWSSSRPCLQEKPPPREDPLPSREEQPLLQEEKLPQPAAPDPSVPPREDLHPTTTPEPPIVDAEAVRRVPDEELPSHREKTRWDISKRFSRLMDELLPKLATVGQKVNTFTGTDYSGIEALRREIKEQGTTMGYLYKARPYHLTCNRTARQIPASRSQGRQRAAGRRARPTSVLPERGRRPA